MNFNRIGHKAVIIMAIIAIIGSCKKPAGPGGKASIKGKVYVKDFDASAYGLIAQYYSQGETVYICYGNDNSVANTVKTSTDGSYEFLYLRKGHYRIFALSRDTSIHVANSNKTYSVETQVDLTSNSQQFTISDLTINK